MVNKIRKGQHNTTYTTDNTRQNSSSLSPSMSGRKYEPFRYTKSRSNIFQRTINMMCDDQTSEPGQQSPVVCAPEVLWHHWWRHRGRGGQWPLGEAGEVPESGEVTRLGAQGRMATPGLQRPGGGQQSSPWPQVPEVGTLVSDASRMSSSSIYTSDHQPSSAVTWWSPAGAPAPSLRPSTTWTGTWSLRRRRRYIRQEWRPCNYC